MRERAEYSIVSDGDLNASERFKYDKFRLKHKRARHFEIRRTQTGIAPHFKVVAKYWLKTKTADITDYSSW